MSTSNVPKKIQDGAAVLMDIFERKGPGPKTGLSGEVALQLGRHVSPREFADMVSYCRRKLAPDRGKCVVYHRPTDQYGFPEDIAQAEQYIVRFNLKYLAARAETTLLACKGAMTQHGNSIVVDMTITALEFFAKQARHIVDKYENEISSERAAHRTGVDATTQLEERVR